jgi:hypothetical protein
LAATSAGTTATLAVSGETVASAESQQAAPVVESGALAAGSVVSELPVEKANVTGEPPAPRTPEADQMPASQPTTVAVAEQEIRVASPQPEVTVIGALVDVPVEDVQTGEKELPGAFPAGSRWLPYGVFILICISLGSLLLLGRHRPPPSVS